MVSSYVQLLAKRYQGRLDSDADEFIGFAVDGAARMQALIQGLLIYSRAGTAEYAVRDVDCSEIVQEILTKRKPRILDDARLEAEAAKEEAEAAAELAAVTGETPEPPPPEKKKRGKASAE